MHYVRSHFVREDETCLFLFEAQSGWAVREACRLAGIAGDRIVEAADIPLPEPWLRKGDSSDRHETEKGA